MASNNEFVEKWNESISSFKVTTEFLQAPQTSSVLNAFESLLLYMGIDLESIRQTRVDAESSIEKQPLYNEIILISSIFQEITASKISFSLLDLYEPSPKRTLRILRELHNFALYYKMASEDIDKQLEDKITTKTDKKNTLSSLIEHENQLAIEMESLQTKIDKASAKTTKSKTEMLTLGTEIEEVMMDIKQNKNRLQECNLKLEKDVKDELKLEDEIQVLRGLVVKDFGILEQHLQTSKMESSRMKDQMLTLENMHTLKTSKCRDLINRREYVTINLLNPLQKNAEILNNCFRVETECIKNSYHDDVAEKEYISTQNDLDRIKSQLREEKSILDEKLKSLKEKCAVLTSEEQSLAKKAVKTLEEVNEAEDFLRCAEEAIENNECMARRQEKEMKDFEIFVREQIDKVDEHSYSHCFRFKTILDENNKSC